MVFWDPSLAPTHAQLAGFMQHQKTWQPVVVSITAGRAPGEPILSSNACMHGILSGSNI